MTGRHAVVDGDLGQLRPGLHDDAHDRHEHGPPAPACAGTPSRGATASSAAGRRCRLGWLNVTSGFAVVGFLRQELVHPALELGGYSAERQAGRAAERPIGAPPIGGANPPPQAISPTARSRIGSSSSA